MMDHVFKYSLTPHALAHTYVQTYTHACTNTFANTYTLFHAFEYPVGCCCEEHFNVFTPPIKRRVGPGMLIACGTMVGFYDDPRFPSRVISYIGNNFISFQPTRIRTTRAVSCVLSAWNTIMTIEQCGRILEAVCFVALNFKSRFYQFRWGAWYVNYV